MSVTFKKQKAETGLAAMAHPYTNIDIKFNKKKVGVISAPSRFGHEKWHIRFAVKKEPTLENPAPFYWTAFIKKFESEPEARKYAKKWLESRYFNYEFHVLED